MFQALNTKWRERGRERDEHICKPITVGTLWELVRSWDKRAVPKLNSQTLSSRAAHLGPCNPYNSTRNVHGAVYT